MKQANENYDELERLKKIATDYAETRDAVIADELLAIESTVNQQMREISLTILSDATHLPPVLRLEKLNKYTFYTPNDGGTGAQYRGLITFDLANMGVAPVPFVVHDLSLIHILVTLSSSSAARIAGGIFSPQARSICCTEPPSTL